MGKLNLVLCLCVPALLGACALSLQGDSWADDVSTEDAAAVVAVVEAQISNLTAPGDGAVFIASDSGPATIPIRAQIGTALKARGYIIADASDNASHAHTLRYQLTTYEGGYILRVFIDDTVTTTHLVKGRSGQLATASSLVAIRETSK